MSRMYRIERRQLLHGSPEEVWSFFSNPANLPLLTPPALKFVVKTHPLPPSIYPGQIIEYTVSPMLSVPLRWVTEITHVKEGVLFVDEQRFGPYSFWHHEHHFLKQPDGVLMTDIVNYKIPGWLIGDAANSLWVAGQLKEIFEFREKVTAKRFGRSG